MVGPGGEKGEYYIWDMVHGFSTLPSWTVLVPVKSNVCLRLSSVLTRGEKIDVTTPLIKFRIKMFKNIVSRHFGVALHPSLYR